MRPQESRIAQLVRWDARKSAGYVRTLVFEMGADARALVGQVFGVLAVESSVRSGDALAAYIEDAFVQGVFEAVKKLPDSPTQERLFQGAVTRVNHTISTLLDDGGLPIGPHQVTGAIVSRKGAEVVAVAWGHPALLLVRQAAHGGRVYDLLLESGAEERSSKALSAPAVRGFSHLVCGRIAPTDKLLTATRPLREFLDDKTLIASVLGRDPDTAVALIRQALAPVETGLAIAVAVTDAGPLPAPDDQAALAAKAVSATNSRTQASIEQLLETKKQTDSIMEPKLVRPLASRLWAAAKDSFDRWRQRSIGAAIKSVPGWREQFMADEEQRHGAVRARAELRQAKPPHHKDAWLDEFWKDFHAQNAPALEVAPAPAITGHLSPVTASNETASRWVAWRTRLGVATGWWRQRSPWQQAVLVGGILVIVAAQQTWSITGGRARRTAEAAAYKSSFEAITQKLDMADASLIYQDARQSQQLISEVQTAVAALPTDTPERQEASAKLLAQAQTAAKAVRRVASLPAPSSVANIATAGGKTALRQLAGSPRDPWALAADGSLYRLSAAGGVDKSFAPPTTPVALATVVDDRPIAINESGQVLAASGGAWTTVADALSPVTAVAAYNSRLYLLEAAQNRILRASPAGIGWAAPQPYLKDGTDLSQASDLAIDGEVFVLMKNGTVAKLQRGIRQQFAVEAVEPPLAAAKVIRLTADSIYVLEAESGRLIRHDRQSGRLFAQYEDDSLRAAADFLVKDDDSVLLIAAGNRLMRYELAK